MPIIPLKCPNCGGDLMIESEKDTAICSCCGKPFVVKDAVTNSYVTNNAANNITNNVAINAVERELIIEKDFEIKSGVLVRYKGESPNVIVPDMIKTIGQNAFSNLAVETIKIPDGITTIESNAFYNCRCLKYVLIPKTVTEMIESFNGINSGASLEIEFEEGMTKIPDNALINDILSLVSEVEDHEISSVKSVIIPDSVKEIGAFAFANCESLASIHIPDSVTEIGDYAFANCRSLRSIHIPDTVTEISKTVFGGCESLSSISIGNNVKVIGEQAFFGCESLSSVTIGNSVEIIGSKAFSECNSLTSIVIPDSVTEISEDAFSNCEHESSDIEKLKNLSELLKTRKRMRFYASYSNKNQYIRNNCTRRKGEIKEPQKPSKKEASRPNRPLISFGSSFKNYQYELEQYEKAERFNMTEYPKLLTEYEEQLSLYETEQQQIEQDYQAQVQKAEQEWNEFNDDALDKLPEINRAIGKYSGFLNEYYYDHVDRLVQILERGRADSISSAINVLESDLHNERMLEEERKRNRILQQQQIQEQRYRERMIYEADRQAAAAERQEREARERAERAERETERDRRNSEITARYNKDQFDMAKKRYESALYGASATSDPRSKEKFEEEAAKAYGDMLKYK